MAEPTTTRPHPVSWPAFTAQAIGGVLLLLAAFWILATIPFRVILLAYLAHVIGGGLTLAFLLVCAAVVGAGLRLGKPGLAWSPLIFCLLWFVASVVHRAALALGSDVQARSGTVPSASDLAEGALTVHGGSDGTLKLLAEQRVKEIVEVTRFGDGRPATRRRTDHRRGSACVGVETVNTRALTDAGRLDECFVADTTVSEPDGVVLRIEDEPPLREIGRFIVKRDGMEHEVARWTSDARRTLSYYPVIGFGIPAPEPRTGVWRSPGGGPFQLVFLGRTRFTATEMTEAMAGVRLSDPILPPAASPGELIRRALALSSGNYSDRLSAMKLVETVRRLGFAGPESLAIAAAMFGESAQMSPELYAFWNGLDDGRRRRLLDIVFARLSDSSLASWRSRCDDVFHTPRGAVEERASAAFAIVRSQEGLGRWQYECALRFVHLVAIGTGFDNPNYRGVQREAFGHIAQDETRSFASRAVAFCNVFILRRSEEVRRFTERMGLVPDALLDDYLGRCGGRLPVKANPDDVTSREAVDAFRAAARSRIAQVEDEKLKASLAHEYR